MEVSRGSMLLINLLVAIVLAAVHWGFSDVDSGSLVLIVVSALMLFLASARLQRKAPSVMVAISLAVFFLLLIFLNLAYLASSAFTGNGITQQTFDHLSANSFKAGFDGWFWYQIGLAIIPIVFVFVWFFHRRKRASFNGGSNNRLENPITVKQSVLTGLCLVLSLVLHPATADIGKHYWYQAYYQGVDASLAKEYKRGHVSERQVSDALAKLKQKPPKNVVLIYLESYERAALDNTAYPNMANNLRKLESQGTKYGRFLQTHGTSHTIAGIVSSQCGVPFAATGGGGNTKNNGGGSYFMPHVQCLADVTKRLGYRNVYYQGGHLDFTRKRAFFSAHGYHQVAGYDEPWSDIAPENKRGWGFHDDVLYRLASEKIDELAALSNEQPFLFTMLTLDTHDASSGDKRMSKSCYDKGVSVYYDLREHAIQDQLYCSDALVGEFVKSLKQKHGDTLDIYIASDHLPHSISVIPSLRGEPNRELIFLKVAGNGDQPQVQQGRQLSHLDIAATILDEITEGQINRLGMGVSLWSDRSTLIEKYGIEVLDEKIKQSLPSLANMYWKYPNLENVNLAVDIAKKEVHVGEHSFPLPVAFQLDKNNEILSYHSTKIEEHLKVVTLSERIIYVDKCGVLNSYQPNDFGADQVCVMAGNLGADNLFMQPVDSKTGYTLSDFSAHLEQRYDIKKHIARLYERPSGKVQRVQSVASKAIHPIAEAVFSAGTNLDSNMVSNYWNVSKFEKFKGFKNHKRAEHKGLYLYEVNQGKVALLKVWSSCEDKNSAMARDVISGSSASEFVLMTGQKNLSCTSQKDTFEGTVFHQKIAKTAENETLIAYWNKDTDHYKSVSNSNGDAVELRLIDQSVYVN